MNTTFFSPCILASFATNLPFCHRIMASSNNESISPLAALAPLHSLAQLVPSASPETGPTRSGREYEEEYILLTRLKPDAWLVHVGRPDGRWWKGAWRISDMEKLAVCASILLPPSSQFADVFVFLLSKSGDMSSARVGAFAQRIARTIVQLEVAVAHEGVDFQNMKVTAPPRLHTAVNFSFCLLARAWYSDQKTDSHCS